MNKTQIEKEREKYEIVLAFLVQRHPLTFFPKDSSETQPLMRGIYHLIRGRHPEISARNANIFLNRYTKKNRYLRALVEKPSRVNMDGVPVEDVSETHRKMAIEKLARREARDAERQAA